MEKELEVDSLELAMASQTKRMLNYFIDTITSILFYFIVLILIMIILGLISDQILQEYYKSMIAQYITTFAALFLYYYALEKATKKKLVKFSLNHV